MANKSVLIAVTFIACIIKFTALHAADWSGPYLGANFGYAWGHSDAVSHTNCGTFVPFYFNCDNLAVVEASGTGSLSATGVLGGVQAGYNWNRDRWVLGGEVDFGAANFSASRSGSSAYLAAAPGVPFTTRSSVKADWLTTLRGRAGWLATPDVMIFATGGAALTELKIQNTFNDEVPGAAGSGSGISSSTKVGWTLGAGGEWALQRSWAVRAEFLYVKFGNASSSLTVNTPPGPGANSVLTTSSDLVLRIARIGISYRF